MHDVLIALDTGSPGSAVPLCSKGWHYPWYDKGIHWQNDMILMGRKQHANL